MAKARKQKAAATPQDTMTLTAPDGCYMTPAPNVDRPFGSWTDAQLGSYIRHTIYRGDVGLLLFVCDGQTWARRVAPPARLDETNVFGDSSGDDSRVRRRGQRTGSPGRAPPVSRSSHGV